MPRFPGTPGEQPQHIETEPTQGAQPGDRSYREEGDAALRAAATELGLDFDAMSDDDKSFLETYSTGALDAIDAADADPENPLIPVETPESLAAVPDPGTPPDPDAPSVDGGATTLDADGTGVRTGAEASAGAPPSLPPSGAPEPLQYDPTATVVLDLGDGNGPVQVPVANVVQFLVSQPQLSPEETAYLNLMRQGLIQPALTDPRTGAPLPVQPGQPAPSPYPTPQPPQPSPYNPQPTPTIPGIPPADEWVDPNAYAAFQTLAQQQQQQAALVQQWLDAQAAQEAAAIDRAVIDGANNFAQQHPDLTEADIATLFQHATQFNMLAGYSQHYPGNPVGAVQAALENSLYTHPTYRERMIQERLAREAQANLQVEQRRAAASALNPGGGTQPRVSAQPQTQAEVDAAIVAMIEADMAGGRQQ